MNIPLVETGNHFVKLEDNIRESNVSTDRFGWNKAMKITEIEYQDPSIPEPGPKIRRQKTGANAKRFSSLGKSR